MGEKPEGVMIREQAKAWGSIVLLILCSVAALGALGVLAWAVVAGELLTLDGLLLASICLLFVLLFGGNVAWSFHSSEAQSILRSLSKSAKDRSE